MPTIPTIEELLKVGAHFGHALGKRHPKAERYIYTARGGAHIINVEETQKGLEHAATFVKELGQQGKVLLFVGTKPQAQPLIKKYAEECGMPYVTSRWLGGLITNFEAVSLLLNTLRSLKHQRETGELEKYTKAERVRIEREITKMEAVVGGIETLMRVPDALFIVDVGEEKTAVREAARKGIAVVAICDTNVNPEPAQYCIPGNDDAVQSIELFVRFISAAYNEGKGERVVPVGGEQLPQQ